MIAVVLASGLAVVIVGTVLVLVFLDEILDWFKNRKRRERKVRLRLSTRRRQRKLRKAGREAEEALSRFHNTKKRIRIEARRDWQDKYDELWDELQPELIVAHVKFPKPKRRTAIEYMTTDTAWTQTKKGIY